MQCVVRSVLIQRSGVTLTVICSGPANVERCFERSSVKTSDNNKTFPRELYMYRIFVLYVFTMHGNNCNDNYYYYYCGTHAHGHGCLRPYTMAS